ncbi:TetR/AcrR family transcriptional regulator [Saccharopolyspora indica]|uniref:TetR/AcrR family transcriptional regulator n=1 Tax=Saccharopolyspora indica TaxID=1229659 RepID=UPI0022EB451A|nr:helix-turn-helix domain-containing protein [Saccharopolyspora indica]MDA3647460.1 helix-turn-helix domain containing protein [Saccharopolyspora indica]
MARALRRHVDEEILDRAAALFAQHGFEQTSLKALADAVGLSKAGLLHHYPSKEALHEAALEFSAVRSRQVLDRVAALPLGPERDRRVLELLTDTALDRPGLVALLFRPVTTPEAHNADQDALLSELFAIDPSDEERLIRVTGALSALAVLSLAANYRGDKTSWRPRIVDTCFDALGRTTSGGGRR